MRLEELKTFKVLKNGCYSFNKQSIRGEGIRCFPSSDSLPLQAHEASQLRIGDANVNNITTWESGPRNGQKYDVCWINAVELRSYNVTFLIGSWSITQILCPIITTK